MSAVFALREIGHAFLSLYDRFGSTAAEILDPSLTSAMEG